MAYLVFVLVRLLSGWREPLWYRVPEHLQATVAVGTFVDVPLRTQQIPALVMKTHPLPATDPSRIKDISGVFAFPADDTYHGFVVAVADFFMVEPITLHHRIVQQLHTPPKADEAEEIPPQTPTQHTSTITFSDEQQTVINALAPQVQTGGYAPTLLQGVTGSGKTEVYKQLIITAINTQKTTICLFPEVTLALQFETIFKQQLPFPERIFSFHSTTKVSEKKKLWNMLLAKTPVVILGVHLPILLPIANLGLILVDEEHERGFQEKRHPKMNSKELALWRAKTYNCPIILGSATPSLSTLHAAKTGKMAHYRLTKRFKGKFPAIIHAKMVTPDKKKRTSFWITNELEAAIRDRLSKKQQTILYLNRRGHSFSAQCQDCGTLVMCQSCSVSLTPHEHENTKEFHLTCHYCSFTTPVPTTCAACKKSEKPLLMKGIGTQQLTTIVQKMFPEAKIARADLDSTKQKREWLKTADQFKRGELDILIGTQLITKGYHFPNVTLVGIVWADLGLSIPDYHTRETVLQKLIQVAGRAGREHEESEVIIQALSHDPLFDIISEEHYERFCETELTVRQELQYPPFGRFVQLECVHSDEVILMRETALLATQLRQLAHEHNLNVTIMGPVEPIIKKIAGAEARHIFLKSPTFGPIHTLLQAVKTQKGLKSSIFLIPT